MFYYYICVLRGIIDKHLQISMKEDNRNKRGSYTRAQKMEAVRILVENSYNYSKTSKITGASRCSLNNWRLLYAKEFTSSAAVQTIAESVEMSMSRAKTAYINKHFNSMSELAEKAIKRAIKLVEEEDDLSKVNDTIKAISGFMSKLTGNEEDEAKKGDTYNLIQQTIVECNRYMKE